MININLQVLQKTSISLTSWLYHSSSFLCCKDKKVWMTEDLAASVPPTTHFFKISTLILELNIFYMSWSDAFEGTVTMEWCTIFQEMLESISSFDDIEKLI